MSKTKEGVIKWFSEDKGYGFIAWEEGEDVFFHFTALEQTGFRRITEDVPVEFEMEEGPKGPKATRVVPID